MKPQTKNKEVRQEGVWTFTISHEYEHETPLSWLEMGTMSDHHEADDIYVDRGKKRLYGLSVAYVKTDNIFVYWDKYTGGTPADDYPFWVAPKEAKDWTIEQILETYERAESYGSEWGMNLWEVVCSVDGVFICRNIVSIATDDDPEAVEESIQDLIAICREDAKDVLSKWKTIIGKVEQDA